MATLYIKLLFVMVYFVDQNRGCEEVLGQEKQYYFDDNPTNRYYFRRQNLFELKTINSTIVCSNVSSVTLLDYSAFQDKPYPQFLKVTNSTIQILPSLVFAKFTSIAKLFLSENHIEDILPGAFTGLRNLEVLNLDGNKITELSNGIYNSLHQLKILNLTNNNIQKIDNFSLMGAAKLEELYLKNNNIFEVGDVFGTLRNLKHLDLSENRLLNIYAPNLTNLNVLDLSKTALRKLNGNWSSIKIRSLNLSSSQFVEIDFAGFPSTENLDLSNNKIVSVFNCELLKSKTVRLENNQIRKILGKISQLSSLNLSNNDLTSLVDFSFNNTGNIKSLNFSYNKITTVQKTLFRRLNTLEQLHLQSNEIGKIDVILFQDLTSLKLLNLSHNKIERFHYGTFDTLHKLEILDISSNRLMDLKQYAFNSLSMLKSLYFHNNKISSIHETDLKKHLPLLEFVSLDRNNWGCKSLANTYNVLSTMSVTILPGSSFETENFKGISCQDEENVALPEDDVQENAIEEVSKHLQKSLDEAMKSSQMVRFFNDGFKNSSFFQFLNNYKPSLEVRENFDEKYMEKLTSSVVNEVPETYNDKIFICVVIVQIVVLALLLFVVCLIFKYMKQKKVVDKTRSFAEMDFF